MKRFRIRIDDRESRKQALYQMMQKGKVVCLRNNEFIVPEPAIQLLDSLSLPFVTIGEEGLDNVVQALRSTVASPV